jgi:RNA polymerase sigma-70 factor (ECF subfamily)
MTTTNRHTAFLRRLEEHRGIVLKIASAYSRTRADREDLAQEIVAQLWRSYARYDERRGFSTWMYRVAINVAISFARRHASYESKLQRSEHALLETIPGAQTEDHDEKLSVLHDFIARLDDLNRALMLLYLDDTSYAEIANILGLSETNVATKIARIKQRLKRDVTSTPAL